MPGHLLCSCRHRAAWPEVHTPHTLQTPLLCSASNACVAGSLVNSGTSGTPVWIPCRIYREVKSTVLKVTQSIPVYEKRADLHPLWDRLFVHLLFIYVTVFSFFLSLCVSFQRAVDRLSIWIELWTEIQVSKHLEVAPADRGKRLSFISQKASVTRPNVRMMSGPGCLLWTFQLVT